MYCVQYHAVLYRDISIFYSIQIILMIINWSFVLVKTKFSNSWHYFYVMMLLSNHDFQNFHHNCNEPSLHTVSLVNYRNWPRYGLRWSGWYCHQAQHELCRPSRGRAGRHNECCAWWQYHPRQRRPYKWSISILPRSQFYKKQGKLAFSTSCTAVRPHRRLRNDAWRRDS